MSDEVKSVQQALVGVVKWSFEWQEESSNEEHKNSNYVLLYILLAYKTIFLSIFDSFNLYACHIKLIFFKFKVHFVSLSF